MMGCIPVPLPLIHLLARFVMEQRHLTRYHPTMYQKGIYQQGTHLLDGSIHETGLPPGHGHHQVTGAPYGG